MKLSFVYLSYRPGGIDMIGQSLSGQEGDFELIVVDDCPGRVERGVAAKFLRETCGLPLAWYGPSKPKSYLAARCGITNAMNTGALRSAGQVVVFLNDYTMVPVKGIAAWEEAFADLSKRELVQGIAAMYTAPMPDKPGDVYTWNGPVKMEANRWWIPGEFEGFYLGCPLSFFSDINGMDERADYSAEYTLKSLMAQAKLNDWRMRVEHGLICHMVDHRLWDARDGRFSTTDSPWRIFGHISGLREEPLWEKRSPNPYDFATERKRCLAERGRK